MTIDSHVHFSNEKGYAARLAKQCRRLGIDKVCLLGGEFDGQAISGGILRALKDYPDLFLGFGMFRLGRDHPDAVDAFRAAGFTGLKCIRPLANYDDKSYFRVYERAEKFRMPMLFHLGIVARGSRDKYMDVNCDRMRPVHLDAIARAFPKLKIIGAHFGNPWSDEAAMVARWNPNLFFDLSGSILKYRPPEYFKQLLWWGNDPTYRAPDGTGPWDKMLFGTDVGIDAMAGVMDDYRRLMDALNLSEKDRKKVWGGNARRLLGLK
jgi:predicted TIM-barrel fold metal-dependent hydrolase